MRLESLSLREWRVFEHLDHEFADGLIGVRGQNGVGKTTLAEAIGWALFGKLRGRAKVSELRRQGAPDGARSSVTLAFRIGDVRYRVERVVNGSARLWIGDAEQPETSQTRATNVRIAQELNMTWDLFCRTVYARQKDVAALDPEATGDARRQHVERLLGLGRVRDAAGKARDEHRRIKAHLDGMRAAAPDVPTLRERLGDAERKAADTPAVANAQQAANDARSAFEAAREASVTESERAATHAALAPRVEQLERDVSEAEERLQRAQQRCDERDAAAATVKRLAPEVGGADEAEARSDRWQALKSASDAQEAARDALADNGFDPERDAERAAALQDLRRDLGELVVPDGVAALSARVEALDAVARSGDLEDAQRREREAEDAAGSLGRTAARLDARLTQEREHLHVLAADDGDPSCPVCLRPFDGSRDALIAEHQARIDRLADHARSADTEHDDAKRSLDEARRAREAASQAARALAATVGAATLPDAREALALASVAREEALTRQACLQRSVAELEHSQRAAEDLRRRHGQLAATLAAREQDVAGHLQALGVTAYDPGAHAQAAAEAERLEALRHELVGAQATVAARAGCEAEVADVTERLAQRREDLTEVCDALSRLAFDPQEKERLAEAERRAEARWDERREEAERLRIAAAEASKEVAGLREQIVDAERRQGEISAAEAEARAHDVAHSVLIAYRDAQTQRAWPALEQTAGALLAQATEGRYADVRFSRDDFRLVIVDRGEEHTFDRFSGGEQDLANLCVRLAIADWIARERDVEFGFVVLDEVFGSQDDDRRRGLMEQLRRLSERFHQMLVITHVPEIADQCDTVIALEQPEEGRSRISA